MNSKKRNLIIIASIVIFVIAPIVIYAVTRQTNQTTPQPDTSVSTARSNQEITSAIITDQPGLANNGQPIFAIQHVSRIEERWYIVTIRNNDDPEGLNAAKVLLRDQGKDQGLTMLLGPGTSFPSEVTQSLDLPGPVAEELNK
jgi:hypothetical protein